MIESEKTLSKKVEFQKLLNIVPDAIVIVGMKGKIEYINSYTESMFGYRTDELIGKEIEILMPNRYRSKHINHRENYAQKPAPRLMGSGIDLYGRKKDGSEFSVDIMLSPFQTENGQLIISVIRDITERKKVEEELKKRAEQLEDLVSALTHDLKTPLLAAETSYKHLQEGYFGKLTDTQEEIIDLLIQNNSQALRLVSSLLSVFKYESKLYKLLLEPVSILEIIEKSVSIIKPLLEEKQLSFKVIESSFEFICDPFEMERVIVNLLTNAIKHTPSGGMVGLQAVKDEDGNVIITVEDTGRGISKEEMPNLFERFWQSRKATANSNSTGLGLYLCRQIVEAHGGKIQAESELNKGTKVIVEIPELFIT